MSNHPDDVFRDPGCWASVNLGFAAEFFLSDGLLTQGMW